MSGGPRPARRAGTAAVRSGPIAAIAAAPGRPLSPVLQAATPTATPGVGPTEVADAWPVLVRAGWFLAGFAVVALLGLFVLRPAVVRIVRRRNRNNPTLTEAIGRYVGVAVVILAVLVGGAVAGYGGLLGSSAIVIAAATLAVGVAGQEVIGSLVSGMALVVDPEFSVGSYIEWSGGQGTVRSITLRVTRILTPDGELVTVPNTVLAGQAITRPFSRGRYRIVERIELGYDADLETAIRHLGEAATEVEGVLDSPSPSVYVDELGGDAVVIAVHYWIGDPTRNDVYAVRSAFARAVKARLDREDVTVAPPAVHDLRGRITVDER